VGGVGVMNIMLMSVTPAQRARIGRPESDRRARRRDVILAIPSPKPWCSPVAGGVIGVLLGGGISLLINLGGCPLLPSSYFPLWAIVLAVGVSMGRRPRLWNVPRHQSRPSRFPSKPWRLRVIPLASVSR